MTSYHVLQRLAGRAAMAMARPGTAEGARVPGALYNKINEHIITINAAVITTSRRINRLAAAHAALAGCAAPSKAARAAGSVFSGLS